MTLRQLLLSGDGADIKEFFKDLSPSVTLILIIVSSHIQTFPEEMRNKEIFLEELKSIREDKDFSDYQEFHQEVLDILADKENWDDILIQAIEVIKQC